MRRWRWENCIRIVYPRQCPVCDWLLPPPEEEKRAALQYVCTVCEEKIQYVKGPYCMKCGRHLADDSEEFCGSCTRKQRFFDGGRALYVYEALAVRRMMSLLKYHNRKDVAEFMGEDMARRQGLWILRHRPVVLVPVPVHPSRKRRRGYNQAAILARELGKWLQLPVEEKLLVRIQKTRPQKMLDPGGRRRNLEGAFALGKAQVPGSVMLIDDIFTTGATAQACTKVLKRGGVDKVYLLCFSMVRGNEEET